jgi:hypothetical protein
MAWTSVNCRKLDACTNIPQQHIKLCSLLHSWERIFGKRDKPYEAAVVRPDELRRFDLSL